MSASETALRLSLPDLSATEALGERIAAAIRPGDAVLLDGPLGAGKSALARALIRAAANDPALEVPSPSYTLVQEYDTGRGPICHLDLWRLEGSGGVVEVGGEEAARHRRRGMGRPAGGPAAKERAVRHAAARW